MVKHRAWVPSKVTLCSVSALQMLHVVKVCFAPGSLNLFSTYKVVRAWLLETSRENTQGTESSIPQ